MRAVLMTAVGGSEVLQPARLPRPAGHRASRPRGSGAAAGINPVDRKPGSGPDPASAVRTLMDSRAAIWAPVPPCATKVTRSRSWPLSRPNPGAAAGGPEAADAYGARSTPVLPITVQYRQAHRQSRRSARAVISIRPGTGRAPEPVVLYHPTAKEPVIFQEACNRR